eukprot:jgi/Antlo1/2352/1354
MASYIKTVYGIDKNVHKVLTETQALLEAVLVRLRDCTDVCAQVVQAEVIDRQMACLTVCTEHREGVLKNIDLDVLVIPGHGTQCVHVLNRGYTYYETGWAYARSTSREWAHSISTFKGEV